VRLREKERRREGEKKSNRYVNPGKGKGKGKGSGVIDHPIDKYGQVKLVSQVKSVEKKGRLHVLRQQAKQTERLERQTQ